MDYIDWLVERFDVERPFVYYHSAMALLYAVRNLPASSNEKLKTALFKSRSKLEKLLASGDHSAHESLSIIEEALKEIEQTKRKNAAHS